MVTVVPLLFFVERMVMIVGDPFSFAAVFVWVVLVIMHCIGTVISSI